jgi:hypothetical protein
MKTNMITARIFAKTPEQAAEFLERMARETREGRHWNKHLNASDDYCGAIWEADFPWPTKDNATEGKG